ncbi:PAB1, partial [Symbiodinium sp. KB8]
LGTIVAVILKCDEETGKNRGVGFVVMSSMEEATKAIEELNGQEAEGKPLNVALSERRRRGERTDGGEGGGGGKGKGEGGKGKGK